MPDNIIERALVPFNPSSNTVLNKDKYNLFAPVANVNKVGMAGFNPEDFNVSDESIVSFSATFRADIGKAVTDAADAKQAAAEAMEAAVTADGKAVAAYDKAVAAYDKAVEAESDASSALSAAGSAVSTAESAAGIANAAKQTAEGIDGKATQAQQDAADALEQVGDKYTKPETGIPKTDLAAAVQSSLGKADTAVQEESDPTVPSWAKQPNKPEYTAAEIAGLATITNLVNYYKKSETYTKTEVNNLISAIPKLSIAVVAELPTVGDPTKIYVIGNKEYLWLADESRYEQFGDLSVDLSNYYDKGEIDGLLAGKVDKVAGKGLSENDLTTALKSSYDSAVADKHTHSNKVILDATTASFLTAEKTKLSGIATGAQVNVKPDWNASAGAAAEILNKPTIPTVPAVATQSEAEAGANNVKMMTPLRVKQAIDALAPDAYTLPTASATVKGGVKIGTGLAMNGEVLNATGGGGTTINVEVLGNWS